MAVAFSGTGGREEQRGARKEDAQCRLEQKSRTTTEVQSLLSGKSSHNRLLGAPFSLSAHSFHRRNGYHLSLLTMVRTLEFPFWAFFFSP